jgi:hypothetical protein
MQKYSIPVLQPGVTGTKPSGEETQVRAAVCLRQLIVNLAGRTWGHSQALRTGVTATKVMAV